MPFSALSTLDVVRRALLVILWVGLVGTEAELLLLKHTDGRWQLFPVVLAAVAMIVLAWYAIARNAAAVRAIQAFMFLFLAAGLIGVWQHFDGNVEYERESDPSLSGRQLYQHAAMGATPTLAPGVLVQLALIGLAFTFRHPALESRRIS